MVFTHLQEDPLVHNSHFELKSVAWLQKRLQWRKPFVVLDDPSAGLGVHRLVQLALEQRGETLHANADVVRRQGEAHLPLGGARGQAHGDDDVLRCLLPEVDGIWIHKRVEFIVEGGGVKGGATRRLLCIKHPTECRGKTKTTRSLLLNIQRRRWTGEKSSEWMSKNTSKAVANTDTF